jgi:hypothetical protein
MVLIDFIFWRRVFCQRLIEKPANEDIQPVLHEITEVENMAVLHLEALVFRRHVRLDDATFAAKRGQHWNLSNVNRGCFPRNERGQTGKTSCSRVKICLFIHSDDHQTRYEHELAVCRTCNTHCFVASDA